MYTDFSSFISESIIVTMRRA